MQPTIRHPSPPELTAFAEGRLDPDLRDVVAEHVGLCPDCRRAVEQARTPVTQPPTPQQSHVAPEAIPPVEGVPPELIDHPRYRILGVLGRGGMGTVFLAEQQFTERTVALKVINREWLSEPDMLKRFFGEIKLVAKLSHPNVVAAFEADRIGSIAFLVMEYVEGADLSTHLKQKGPLPVERACDLARQVALGLQHAHDKGLVHRDIKPHNLMLLPDGQVKILDFGLARLGKKQTAGDGLTQTGVGLGTPGYVAPEQMEDGSTADARADVYSLGCTLYCLLTGRPPFTRGHEKLTEVRPEVPEALAAVVMRMLLKEREKRQQTAAEVARALTPFCTKEGLLAAASAAEQAAAPPAPAKKPPPATCGICEGSGMDRAACFVCDGTGFARGGGRMQCHNCRGKRFGPCYACNGTGVE